MVMKTYPTTVKDGRVYAEVTLRDVVEHNDVSDLPMLTEIKRLYNENDKMREVLRAAWKCIHTGISCYDCRLMAGGCTLQSAMQELGIEVYSS